MNTARCFESPRKLRNATKQASHYSRRGIAVRAAQLARDQLMLAGRQDERHTFQEAHYSVVSFIGDIDLGLIGLSDIQRPLCLGQ